VKDLIHHVSHDADCQTSVCMGVTRSPLAVRCVLVDVPAENSLAGDSDPLGGRTLEYLCQEDPV